METSQFSATEHRVLSNKNNYTSAYTREQERYHCTSRSRRMEVKDSQQAICNFVFVFCFFQLVIWNLLNGKLGFCQCVWRTTGWEGNIKLLVSNIVFLVFLVFFFFFRTKLILLGFTLLLQFYWTSSTICFFILYFR